MYYAILLIFLQISNHSIITNAEQNNLDAEKLLDEKRNSENLLLTAKIYSTIFKERRMEQHVMIKTMLKSTYDKNFKLLKIAYPKIYKVLIAENATITDANYKPTHGFPQAIQTLQSAVIHLLENCCLFAENILHFPEISQRIFAKEHISSWRDICNWCIGFVNSFPHIIDEPTVKLMDLLRQEVNEEYRDRDYYNPYYSKQRNSSDAKTKPRKKLKKGPQLVGNKNEL